MSNKMNLKKFPQKELNPPKLENIKGIPSFDFEQMPQAYFSDNVKGKELRNLVVKNQLKLSECNIKELEQTFFSKENIELINKQLITAVFNKSNKQFLICPQDESNLLIVMRYVFIEYSRNLPFDIKEQIRDLNCRVVSEIAPTIISNVDQKIGYLRDISTQPLGPPLPINTKKINRTLPTTANFM